MRERMLAGEPFVFDDELFAEHARAQRLTERYNRTGYDDRGERRALLEELLGEVGEDVNVRPSLRCDFGSLISIGDGTFINWDAVLLDLAPIRIGADCQFGPRVQLLTATHPIDPEQRRQKWEMSLPVTIGDDVWLGGGVIVRPGVTIGEGTVVGAGSVVTRDLPGGVIAVGNPARVSREITEADLIELPES